MALSINLKLIAQGLTSPVSFIPSPLNLQGFFVVDQVGLIKKMPEPGKVPQAVKVPDEPFLDLTAKIVPLDPEYDERGLLGLAFHPGYLQNRRFYVYYSAPKRKGAPRGYNCTNFLSQFMVEDNMEKVMESSEKILMAIDKPQSNHNGGDIKFGPDGYLYVPLGDGGGANDNYPGHSKDTGNAQDLKKPLGKILRIDVDRGDPYGIPSDNPFVNHEFALKEIWAFGFRNPWRINFDTGGEKKLFAGDVGQYLWEEADIIEKGRNYGWNLMEGAHFFNPENPYRSPSQPEQKFNHEEDLALPFLEYQNAHAEGGGMGCCIIGGYIYRGKTIPYLQGSYIFGDWTTDISKPAGGLFAAKPTSQGKLWDIEEINISNIAGGKLKGYVLSLAQDNLGELYVLTSQNLGPQGNTGKIWKIIPA